jgi:Protein of unknown function (DUF3501)
MQKLKREDLYTLETYAATRADFRERIIAHKRNRQITIGPNATLSFEDRLTMQYQVQEMLRAERIFEPAGIEEELAAYNPLIPDGTNWKATLMLEFPNVDERRAALARLRGVESRVWARVAGHEPVYAIADEDLDRTTEDKTSSVHFLRFELTPQMIRSVKGGAEVAFGLDHDRYRHTLDPLPAAVRDSLASDLNDL